MTRPLPRPPPCRLADLDSLPVRTPLRAAKVPLRRAASSPGGQRRSRRPCAGPPFMAGQGPTVLPRPPGRRSSRESVPGHSHSALPGLRQRAAHNARTRQSRARRRSRDRVSPSGGERPPGQCAEHRFPCGRRQQVAARRRASSPASHWLPTEPGRRTNWINRLPKIPRPARGAIGAASAAERSCC